jgi:acylphosphatase
VATILLEISGRVQGVGFRWFVRERARALGLAGWVRNLPGGEVEVAASGSDEALRALEALVSEGPPAAHVAKVVRRQVDAADFPSPFAVLRT